MLNANEIYKYIITTISACNALCRSLKKIAPAIAIAAALNACTPDEWNYHHPIDAWNTPESAEIFGTHVISKQP